MCRTVRHLAECADEGTTSPLTCNAQPSLTRNATESAEDAQLCDSRGVESSHTKQVDEWQVPSLKWAANGSNAGGEESSSEGKARFGDKDESSVVAMLPLAPTEVPAMVGSFDPIHFYDELLHELERHALRGGTAFGFAVVLKRVALDYGVGVETRPLPRPTRAERQDLAWDRQTKGGA